MSNSQAIKFMNLTKLTKHNKCPLKCKSPISSGILLLPTATYIALKCVRLVKKAIANDNDG